MPWSPWQDAFLADSFTAWGRFYTYTYVIRTPPDSEAYPAPGEGEPYYNVLRLSDPAFPGDPGAQRSMLEASWTDYPGDEPPRTYIQFLLGPKNEDPPAALQPPLFPPDYFSTVPVIAPLPGRPFEYVDYESDRGTLLGWDWLEAPEIVNRTAGPLSGTIELDAPSDYFTHGPALGYDLDDHPDYPLPTGTPVSSFGGADPVGTTLAPLPDPGAVSGFGVTINPVLSTVEAFVGIDLGDVRPRILMPRWRYWIEGDLPLRQFHRDDGLGGSPPRAFGGASRIRSGRAFGYD